MKRDFAFAGLNLNIIIQKKRTRKMHVLCIMLVKTRGVKYFNVETWILFAPYQNFWLRAWPQVNKASHCGSKQQ